MNPNVPEWGGGSSGGDGAQASGSGLSASSGLFVPTAAPFVPQSSHPAEAEPFFPGHHAEDHHTQQQPTGSMQPIAATGAVPSAATAVAYDIGEEKLWVGGASGHLSSHLLPDLTLVSRHPAHAGAVVSIVAHEAGPLSLSHFSVALMGRTAATVAEWRPSTRAEGSAEASMSGQLTSMHLPGGVGDHTVAIGSAEAIALVDLTRGVCVRSLALRTGDTSSEGSVPGAVVSLRRTRSTLCCGESSGRINFRSADTLRVEHGFDAHTGALLSMDVLGDVLVTCGCVMRGGGRVAREPVVKAFDLRMAGRPYLVQQVPCPAPPFAAAFVPGFSGTVVAASDAGHMQLLDVQSPEQPVLEFFHVPCDAALTSLAVSETGECVALADAAGVCHHWATGPAARASFRGAPAEYITVPDLSVDPLVADHPAAAYTEAGCISVCAVAPPAGDGIHAVVGLPPLLSDWPEMNHASVVVGLPPRLPVITEGADGVDFIQRGRNPQGRLANQAPDIIPLDKYAQVAGALQMGCRVDGIDDELAADLSYDIADESVMIPDGPMSPGGGGSGNSNGNTNNILGMNSGVSSSVLASSTMPISGSVLSGRSTGGRHDARSFTPSRSGEQLRHPKRPVLPPGHRHIEIDPAKLNLGKFDFDRHNLTNFGGLENLLPNSYANALLHSLYFLPQLRRSLASHLCAREWCLSCELRFLFSNFDTAEGSNCQAANLLRAFRNIPETAALGLLESETHGGAAVGTGGKSAKVQTLARFVASRVKNEFSTDGGRHPHRGILGTGEPTDSHDKSKEKSPVESMTMTVEAYRSCRRCGTSTSTMQESLVMDLTEPKLSRSIPVGEGPATFARAVAANCRQQGVARGHCAKCELFTNGDQHRTVRTLPPLLFIGTVFEDPSDQALAQGDDASQPGGAGGNANANGGVGGTAGGSATASSSSSSSSSAFLSQQPNTNNNSNNQQSSSFPSSPGSPLQHDDGTGGGRRARPFIYPGGLPGRPLLPMRMRILLGESETIVRVVGSSQGDDDTVNNDSNDNGSAGNGGKDGCKTTGAADGESGAAGNGSWIEYELVSVISEVRDPIRSGTRGAGAVRGAAALGLGGVHRGGGGGSGGGGGGSIRSSALGDTDGHLVAHVRVPQEYHDLVGHTGDAAAEWYVFNDFSILPLENPEQEVTHYHPSWKMPATAVYRRVSEKTGAQQPVQEEEDAPTPAPVPRSLLSSDRSLSVAQPGPRTFSPLSDDEQVGPSLTIAIDAEFCALRHETERFSSEGRITTLPTDMCLARVSLVRATGPRAGEVLIDDYIVPAQSEPIVDYLTRFSGVTAEDLNRATSTRHLTSFKNSYLKLRYLVDGGCKFVGHGLIKDFRILNIKIPRARVIDTVELFKLPRQRRISLRFLAWFILGETIQEGSHDSIVDARTAMRLADRYHELAAQGLVDETLHRLYDEGRKLDWQPPPSSEFVQRPPTQPERFI